MRPLRILEAAFSPVTTVHLMSRVIERRMVLDDVAKQKFRELVARQSAFSQIEIVTFCILSNHFISW